MNGDTGITNDTNRSLLFYLPIRISTGTFLGVEWLRLHAPMAAGIGWVPGQKTNTQHAVKCSQKQKTKKGKTRKNLKLIYSWKEKLPLKKRISINLKFIWFVCTIWHHCLPTLLLHPMTLMTGDLNSHTDLMSMGNENDKAALYAKKCFRGNSGFR